MQEVHLADLEGVRLVPPVVGHGEPAGEVGGLGQVALGRGL